MSRLDELISELCPDGVEYKQLHEVANIQRGVRVVRSQLSTEGQYSLGYQIGMMKREFEKIVNSWDEETSNRE